VKSRILVIAWKEKRMVSVFLVSFCSCSWFMSVVAPVVVCGVTVIVVLFVLGLRVLYCVVVQTVYAVPFSNVNEALAVLVPSPSKLATTL